MGRWVLTLNKVMERVRRRERKELLMIQRMPCLLSKIVVLPFWLEHVLCFCHLSLLIWLLKAAAGWILKSTERSHLLRFHQMFQDSLDGASSCNKDKSNQGVFRVTFLAGQVNHTCWIQLNMQLPKTRLKEKMSQKQTGTEGYLWMQRKY